MSDNEKKVWRMKAVNRKSVSRCSHTFYGTREEALLRQGEMLRLCNSTIFDGWQMGDRIGSNKEALDCADDFFPVGHDGWIEWANSYSYYGENMDLLKSEQWDGFVIYRREGNEHVIVKNAIHPEPFPVGMELLRTTSDLVFAQFLYANEDFCRGRGFSPACW